MLLIYINFFLSSTVHVNMVRKKTEKTDFTHYMLMQSFALEEHEQRWYKRWTTKKMDYKDGTVLLLCFHSVNDFPCTSNNQSNQRHYVDFGG